jgi:hypothetical protein
MKISITEGSTAAGAHSGTRREDRSRRSEGAPTLLDPSLASERLRLPAPFSRLSPPYHEYTDGSSELEYELLLSFGLEPVRARFLLRQVYLNVNVDDDPFDPAFYAEPVDCRLPVARHETIYSTIGNYYFPESSLKFFRSMPSPGMFFFNCMIRIGDPSTKIIRDFATWLKQQKAVFKVLDAARARRKKGYFRRDLVVFALSQEPGWEKQLIVTQLKHMNLEALAADRSERLPAVACAKIVFEVSKLIKSYQTMPLFPRPPLKVPEGLRKEVENWMKKRANRPRE